MTINAASNIREEFDLLEASVMSLTQIDLCDDKDFIESIHSARASISNIWMRIQHDRELDIETRSRLAQKYIQLIKEINTVEKNYFQLLISISYPSLPPEEAKEPKFETIKPEPEPESSNTRPEPEIPDSEPEAESSNTAPEREPEPKEEPEKRPPRVTRSVPVLPLLHSWQLPNLRTSESSVLKKN